MTKPTRKQRAYESLGGRDGKLDWETPNDLFRVLDDEFHFVWDLAAGAHNSKVPNGSFFSEESSAFDHDWPRGPCWLNPPYGKGMNEWADRILEQTKLGTTVVMLIPVRSSTKWWHKLVPHASEVRLMKGRIQFVGADRRAPFPTCVIVFVPNSGPPSLSCIDIARGFGK